MDGETHYALLIKLKNKTLANPLIHLCNIVHVLALKALNSFFFILYQEKMGELYNYLIITNIQ